MRFVYWLDSYYFAEGGLKMNSEQIRMFNQALLHWFFENRRDLPWRRTKNPYYIWISEVMLQQTQVDTVIPYFRKFIECFPTVDALAAAPEQSVLKCWEGLGYYSRARNLQKGVREVAEKYGGKVPDGKKELLSIRGIGPYTAGAILSIAFDEPEPAVDGNVMRVLSRVMMIDQDIAKMKTRKLFESVVEQLIAAADPSAFNQSLMDLGATVCRPKNPKCEICPVRRFCRAFAEGVQVNYPVKSGKSKPRTMAYAVLAIEDESGRIIIERRPDKGLLAGLWQFPMIVADRQIDTQDLCRLVKKNYGWALTLEQQSFSCSHRFSHLIWDLSLYTGRMRSTDVEVNKNRQWADGLTFRQLPFPVPHQKVIDWIAKNRRRHT